MVEKVVAAHRTLNSASNKWVQNMVALLRYGRTWAFRAAAIALYGTDNYLVKVLSDVTVDFSIADTDRMVTITAEDTSADSYTVDKMHVLCVDDEGSMWSAFRAAAATAVTKGSSDALKAVFKLRIPIAGINASGILVKGAEMIAVDLSGGTVSAYAPISRLMIRMIDGTTEVFTNVTRDETMGTEDGVPYIAVKVSAVDSSPDAKSVDTIKALDSVGELAQAYWYYWSKPANTTVTWWLEWRFKYRYSVDSPGAPATY